MAKARLGSLTQSLSTKTPKATNQKVQTPGTVMNNAGGFVYQIDIWDRLERFLILGTDGGSYHCGEKKMTVDNAKNVLVCIKTDGIRTVNAIVDVSTKGRAPKNDAALFALSLCASQGDGPTRKFALDSLSKVARIGTHLFQFSHYVDGFRGWGSGLRNGVANWYNEMKPDRLAFQVIKYPQRTIEEGNPKSLWSHDDLLRKTHARGDEVHNMIYQYVTKDGKLPTNVPEDLRILEGAQKVKGQTNASVVASLIEEYELPLEVVPKEVANDPKIWHALIPHMPIGATLYNLNKMTSYGVLKPLSSNLKTIIDRLNNQDLINKGRIHPIKVLAALKTYSQGHGMKGKLTWNPISQINDALNEMIYMAFDAVEPSGKNILIALDISGSMEENKVSGMDFVSAREASAVMALATARSEKNYHIVGFTSTGFGYNGCTSKWGESRYPSRISPLNISPRQRMDDVCKYMSGLSLGGTNCALPMMYALENKLDVDAFFVYTDNETWQGEIKAAEALRMYRNARNPQAKLVVVGTSATEFSIADQNDAGSMDVVGFDSDAPAVMSEFIRRPFRTKNI